MKSTLGMDADALNVTGKGMKGMTGAKTAKCVQSAAKQERMLISGTVVSA
jgi:hypothetical protein